MNLWTDPADQYENLHTKKKQVFLNFDLIHCLPTGEHLSFLGPVSQRGLMGLYFPVLHPLSHSHCSNGEGSHDSWKFIHVLFNHMTPGTAV